MFDDVIVALVRNQRGLPNWTAISTDASRDIRIKVGFERVNGETLLLASVNSRNDLVGHRLHGRWCSTTGAGAILIDREQFVVGDSAFGLAVVADILANFQICKPLRVGSIPTRASIKIPYILICFEKLYENCTMNS